MTATITWADPEELGRALFEAYPEENPLDVESEDLLRMVEALEGFRSSGAPVTREVLEQAQMEWFAEYSANSC